MFVWGVTPGLGEKYHVQQRKPTVKQQNSLFTNQHTPLLGVVHFILRELNGLHDERVPHVQCGQVQNDAERRASELQKKIEVQLQRFSENPALDLEGKR
jgi:hypothetical protein